MCARDTLPGISSVSTLAAKALGKDIKAIAISQAASLVFRYPCARITLNLVHVDRYHVHDTCNQQHEKQRDVQHVPKRKQSCVQFVFGRAPAGLDAPVGVAA